MNIVKVIIVSLSMLLLAGCWQTHHVETAHVGKLVTKDGFSPDILETGRHISWPVFWNRYLVQLSVATQTPVEPLEMILADRLTLRFDLRTRMSINRDPDVLHDMFNSIQPREASSGNNKIISFTDVYNTYGQMAVLEQARRVMSQYTVEEVQQNYGQISDEIYVAVRDALRGTPLRVESLTLGNIQYPDVVMQAIEVVKQRDLEILEAEAVAQRRLVEAKRDLELARAQREIELTRATTTRDSNKIIGEGVTKEFLALKQLEMQALMAENDSAVFLPFDALNAVGPQVRMFQQ